MFVITVGMPKLRWITMILTYVKRVLHQTKDDVNICL